MRDDHRNPGLGDSVDGARTRELTFAVDDEDAPTVVTVSPRRSSDNTTAWLTMDVDHVVDLSEHA